MKYCERGKSKMQTETEYKQAARRMTDVVNPMCFDAEALAKELDREHRTLQQKLFGAFLQWVVTLARNYEMGQCDLRNEAACKIASRIHKEILEGKWEYRGKVDLPYV
jgi:hypothetical protein